MIEKREEKEEINIQDNFLAQDEFTNLRVAITTEYFPWYFSPCKVEGEDQSTSPGQFFHLIYKDNIPRSEFFGSHFLPIISTLDISILSRIKLNLNPRLQEPFYSDFHVDMRALAEDVAPKLTTSIFYIGTNNGYTEFEGGTKVKSVANRLVSFPLNIKHRGVTQTDEQRRMVINFNYLKGYRT